MNTQGRLVDINLMPWRESLRERRTRRFTRALLVAVVLGCGVAGLEWCVLQSEVANQEARLEYIDRRTELLEHDIRSVNDLEARRVSMNQQIELISSLQKRRPTSASLFSALKDTLQDGVVYEQLVRTQNTLKLRGNAPSNRQISEQLRAFGRSSVFSDPMLQDVKADSAAGPRQFNVQMTLTEAPGPASNESGGAR
ncbi:PilN domain-containing protein [Larsenimonas salina]|uniref:PilN domain-containing protein n=1 Tax=Larsenimonas salina TaxID=1295565 RepID=UPI002073C0D2|nr:PilN domain-containing protein [Larsenimonas salina]MCM5704159.1 PilN domain-containing protein [Larsenimonas salina]